MKQTRVPECPAPPAPWIYRLSPRWIERFLTKRMALQCHVTALANETGPFVLLANHASVYDPLILAYAVKEIPLNFVGGYDYFRLPGLRWLLQQLGAIRKFQYHTDLAALRAMNGVIQRGGHLALFPTGRLSTVGEGRTNTIALVKLIKKWGVPVYGAKLEGTYFIKPKWAKNRRYGPVTVTIQRLFSTEEIQQMPSEEMLQILNQLTGYDAYRHGNPAACYQGRALAEYLETILYHCPHCHQEFQLSSKGDQLQCRACHTQWTLLEHGRFQAPTELASPHEWVQMQASLLRQDCVQDSFQLQTTVTHWQTDLRTMKKTRQGEGSLTLTPAAICFVPQEGAPYRFSILTLDSLPFRAGHNIELASDVAIHTFELTAGNQAIKWSLAVEALAAIRQQKSEENG